MTREETLLEYLRTATAELVSTREQLARATGQAEPIAIVGMACRLPGGIESPDGLWRLVADGGELVGEFPGDRGWPSLPDGPNGPVAERGAFLTDAGGFDYRFFRISRREALAMDPQQRVALEVAWGALESAGIAPVRETSDCGVFVGATSFQYGGDMVAAPEEVAGHLLIGTVTSVLSGRIAYVLGSHGPCLTLDTACSSSLVALHLASASLRAGECSVALAGGATVMSTPGVFAEFHRQGGLAPDGRCKSFSGTADGTGWGEGVGMVVLETLSAARAAGHPVLALLEGSAWNHGGTANGLTAPNGAAQQAVIRGALHAAGLNPDDIDVIEAHGTGTRLGDPIEATALLGVFGRRSVDRPLWLGSLKSNTAHTQAAAGVCGVIKMVEALRHGTLPRTLHAEDPTAEVDWDAGNIRLLTEPRPWPRSEDRIRRAGVSAFGVGGTNAHVVLREPPPGDPSPVESASSASDLLAFAVSAVGETALAEVLSRTAAAARSAAPADLAGALARRHALPDRAVVFATPAEAADMLDRASTDLDLADDSWVRGSELEDPRPVFVYPGQGAQWAGMVQDLVGTHAGFTDRLDACAEALRPHLDFSVIDALRSANPGYLSRVDAVQPMLWAIGTALTTLWESVGVQPAAVIGHSQGEIAAATASGQLSLEDGARIVAQRSALLRRVAGRGGMVSVLVDTSVATDLIDGLTHEVAIAAVNGPATTVVSGSLAGLAEVQRRAADRNIEFRRIDVDYGSHSPEVDELAEELDHLFADLAPGTPRCPQYSTVTAAPIGAAGFPADYWFRNLRSTVCLVDAIRLAAGRGHKLFVEVSPHPVLVFPVRSLLEILPGRHAVIGTLRRGTPGPAAFARSVGEAWTLGAPVAPDALAAPPRRPTPVPAYPFQHGERLWLAPRAWTRTIPASAVTWTAAEPARSAPSGRWVVVDPDATGIAEALARAGVVVADPGADDRSADAALFVVPRGSATAAALATAEFLRSRSLSGPATIGVLTRSRTETVDETVAAATAIAATFAAEEPTCAVTVVDLPLAPGEAELRAALGLIAAGSGEQAVCRADRSLVRRLAPAEVAPVPLAELSAAVVVGGFGRVGALIATALAESGTPVIVLIGRRGLASPSAEELVARLKGAGARVEVLACDAADGAALRAGLEAIDLPAVGLAIHAAGVLRDEPTSALTADALTDVMTAKLGVARGMAAAFADSPTRLVYLTGLPGTVAVTGQASWAAATAATDAFAAGLAAAGRPVTRVALTAVSGVGDVAATRAIGVTPLSATDALAVLGSATAGRSPTGFAGAVDWDVLLDSGRIRPMPLLRDVLRAGDRQAAALPDWSRLELDEATRRLTDLVRSATAAALRTDPSEVSDDLPFKALGLDSLTAIQLRNRINAATGLALPVTAAFDHPSPAHMVVALLEALVGQPATEVGIGECLADLERFMDTAGGSVRAEALARVRAGMRRWTASEPEAAATALTDDEWFAALDAELGTEERTRLS